MNNQLTNSPDSADALAFDVSFPRNEQQPLDAHTLSSEVGFFDHHPGMFNYINHLLMEEEEGEENVNEHHPGMFHDPSALRAAEKSLYEVLGKDCPPLPSEKIAQSPTSSTASASTISSLENQSVLDPRNFLSGIQCSSFLSESDTLLQFKKGLEEGNKFLPAGNQLILDLDQYELPSEEPNEEVMANYGKNGHWSCSSRGKKQQDRDPGSGDEIDAGRSSKQSAISSNEVELAETFEKMLVFFEEPCPAIDFDNPTGSKDPKASNEKRVTETVSPDLIALLIASAHCVGAGDHKSANEKLMLIRQYSSATGSAHQRLAIPFANALEARLAGVEPDYCGTMTSKLTSAAEELKAYRFYLSAPFRQIYAFFTNRMILEASSKAENIRIVDFGIGHGFHWPGLIEQLSSRPGGPPKLRITGIGIPQPGFRPAERIQQTGRRLAKYSERYNVPFDYQAIAIKKWHRFRLEELKLEKNEWLAVNCQFRFRSLLEDQAAEGEDDPKDAVLRIIREMNPDICLTEVISAQYGGPFFLSRFREALYFFSTLFDLHEQILPREDKHRIKYEQEVFGQEVMNVVACEGSARVERPETYRQWEARYKNGGFRAIPLNLDLVKELRNTVKAGYHKDFMLDEDGCWVLQGWKGRTISAFSCWLPS